MTMSLAHLNYPENQIQNRRFIVASIGLLALMFLLTLLFKIQSALSLILAAQTLFFLFGFRRPVWAVASLLVGQLTASDWFFVLSGTLISVRFLWTIFAGIFLIAILFKEGKIEVNRRARRVLLPAIIFFILAIIANAANTDLSFTLQYLRQVSTALVALIILPAVVKNEQDLKILALVAVITCTISALFALSQHYHFRFLPLSTTIFGEGFVGRRAWGLTAGPVILGFILPLVIIPALCLIFHGSINRRYYLVLIFSILLMSAATYFTYTRSAIYSFGAGMIAMILFMKIKIKKELFLAAIILCVSFVIYTDMKQNRYSTGISNETSAAGRLVLWQAGAQIAMSSPILGIGGRDFEKVSRAYTSKVEVNTSVIQAQDVLGVQQPHNDFLRVWVSYGTPALIAFLWFFVAVFRNLLEYYRKSSRRFAKGLALGLFAALTTYIVNAFSHNVMDSVFVLWIFGGLSIALFKLGSQKNLDTSEVKA
jgi:O-antigen ligase